MHPETKGRTFPGTIQCVLRTKVLVRTSVSQCRGVVSQSDRPLCIVFLTNAITQWSSIGIYLSV